MRQHIATQWLTQHHGVQAYGVQIGWNSVVLGVTHKGIDVVQGEVKNIKQEGDTVVAQVVAKHDIPGKNISVETCRSIQIAGPKVKDILGDNFYSLDDIANIVKQFRIRLPEDDSDFKKRLPSGDLD